MTREHGETEEEAPRREANEFSEEAECNVVKTEEEDWSSWHWNVYE